MTTDTIIPTLRAAADEAAAIQLGKQALLWRDIRATQEVLATAARQAAAAFAAAGEKRQAGIHRALQQDASFNANVAFTKQCELEERSTALWQRIDAADPTAAEALL